MRLRVFQLHTLQLQITQGSILPRQFGTHHQVMLPSSSLPLSSPADVP